MAENINVVDLSRYGAGNEFIANSVLNCVEQHTPDLVLVQWTMPRRLDLLLSHSDETAKIWKDTIDSDPVYCQNVLGVGGQCWWLSSSSQCQSVRHYHDHYISVEQHQNRSRQLIDYVRLWFNEREIDYKFMLSVSADYLKDRITKSVWSWHQPWQGLHEFRNHSDYAELDFGLTQPISLVQFDFIKKYLMPTVNLDWHDNNKLTKVENLLYKQYQTAKTKRPR